MTYPRVRVCEQPDGEVSVENRNRTQFENREIVKLKSFIFDVFNLLIMVVKLKRLSKVISMF